jgi:hypothetical protein
MAVLINITDVFQFPLTILLYPSTLLSMDLMSETQYTYNGPLLRAHTNGKSWERGWVHILEQFSGYHFIFQIR